MPSSIQIQNIHDQGIGIAERKGLGHPDTICDAITEQVSKALCNFYLETFGIILHHNVDKALLIGGAAQPAYKGGKIITPMNLILAGRATCMHDQKSIPIDEITVQTAQKWIQKNIRHLDPFLDVIIDSRIRPGSTDLTELFKRFGKDEVPLSNDTSFGAGFYPVSSMENRIIEIEQLLNSNTTKSLHPYIGEDIKVMGVDKYGQQNFTISIAMVDKYIDHVNSYIEKINMIEAYIKEELSLEDVVININTADDYDKESLYLTVTGTSAEHGDDGQVGRGNRINGLITPYHPMSLEATSGKNPVSHIGKIYNYFAMDVSRAIVENGMADYANVFIVSQIGKPIDQPQLFNIKLKNTKVDKRLVEELANDWLGRLAGYWRRIIDFDAEY